MRRFLDHFLASWTLAAVVLGGAAHGQEPEVNLDDARLAKLHERTVQFLEGVSLGRADTALGELLANGPLAKQTDAVKKLVDEIRTLESRYGKYRAFERIDAKRIGQDLVLTRYLYKCENYPVVWYFTYYRDFKRSETVADSNNWVLIGVRFDTELELLGF